MHHAFTIRRLKWGAFVIEGDNNFPHRAELAGHYDIDGDKHKIMEAVGLGGIRTDAVIVDCGAFVGDTAAIFAKCGAQVIGVEPFLDAAVCAWLNTRALPNVKILHAPTGNGEHVELVFECPGPNFGMRSVRVCPADKPGAIQTLKIDDLMLTRLDFLKIDVEGREIETLLGARETIERCRPVLFVEMYEDGLRRQGHTPQELEDTLRSLNYDLKMWGEPPRWDWLCHPREIVIPDAAAAVKWPGTAAEHRVAESRRLFTPAEAEQDRQWREQARLREDAPPSVVRAAAIRAGAEIPGGTPVDPATIPPQPPVDNDHVADGAQKFGEKPPEIAIE